MKREISSIRILRVVAWAFKGLAAILYLLGAAMLLFTSIGVLGDLAGQSWGIGPADLTIGPVGPTTFFVYAFTGAVWMAPAFLASAVARWLADDIGRELFGIILWTWPVPAVVFLVSSALSGELWTLVVLMCLTGIVVCVWAYRRAPHDQS